MNYINHWWEYAVGILIIITELILIPYLLFVLVVGV